MAGGEGMGDSILKATPNGFSFQDLESRTSSSAISVSIFTPRAIGFLPLVYPKGPPAVCSTSAVI